jgi:hypothetical protein
VGIGSILRYPIVEHGGELTASSTTREKGLISESPACSHRVDLEHRLHKRMMSMGPSHFDAKLIDVVGRFMTHRVRRYDVFIASKLPTP